MIISFIVNHFLFSFFYQKKQPTRLLRLMTKSWNSFCLHFSVIENLWSLGRTSTGANYTFVSTATQDW